MLVNLCVTVRYLEKTDARKLSQEAQSALREQIIRLRKQGQSNRRVAEIVGATERHTSKIWQLYLRDGSAAIELGRRGRRQGTSRKMSFEQEAEMIKILTDRAPDELKLPFALWTRNAVRLAIKQRYGADLPLRTITDYLKRWGFILQNPIKRACERNPRQMQLWLETAYPAIAAQAKREKAEIHGGYETAIQNEAYIEAGFSPKGKNQNFRIGAQNSRINMISSRSKSGKARFMLYRKKVNSDLLINFMFRLIKDSPKKVFLILDNLRVDHNQDIKEWLDANKAQIEVFHLPSYHPELNLDKSPIAI